MEITTLKDTFFSLSPEKVLEAVESTGVRCTGRILALNSMENRVYEVEIELKDPPASKYDSFRVVKFYRPGRWTREQILEEHEFISQLNAQDIPAVAPLKFDDGSTLKEDSETGINFTVFPRVGGRNLDELQKDELEMLGRLLARLHNAGAARTFSHRISLNVETYGRINAQYLKAQKVLPPEIESYYLSLVEEICNLSEPLFKPVKTQRVHGDLHCGNILWTRGQGSRPSALIVDFDDTLKGPCVQDLWLLIPGRDEESKARWDTVLTGYQQMRNFDRNELKLVEPLRALRMVHFNAWIARRWDDPSFKRVFSAFGSAQYWRDQLTALSECRDLVRQQMWGY